MLYTFILINRVSRYFYNPYAPETLEYYIPEGDFSRESRLKKETSKLIWEKIKNGEWPMIERGYNFLSYELTGHSAAVVAADEAGNVAAILHTINTHDWGKTGIFIDGISISDSAAYNKHYMAKAGAGNYWPYVLNPCIVLKDELPIIASSCVSYGLHSETVQNIYNIMAFNLDPDTSLKTSRFLHPSPDDYFSHEIRRNSFPNDIIDSIRDMGQSLILVGALYQYWAGIKIDNQNGIIYGAASQYPDCHAVGY
jgi:hypothetical protein